MKMQCCFTLKGLQITSLALILLSAGTSYSADVVISEFMALNTKTLADEDGDYSDWIELHNVTLTNVNLEGWFLTDNTNSLSKWRFPATNLPPNGFLVVFASGKNRAVPGNPLHTSFQLNGNGEYLALIRPDLSIATEFYPTFPPQYPDISFGDGREVRPTMLVSNGMTARYFVPAGSSPGTNWASAEFNDSSWSSGVSGFGFSKLADLAQTNLYGYWPVDEGSGTVTTNLAGGANGTISGATWVNDPDRGYVLEFNGTSSYVSAGTIPRLSQYTSNFTWSFWWKQLSVPNNLGVILGNRSGGVQSPLQFIKFTPTRFEYYRGGDIGFMYYTIPNNQWLHLCVVKSSNSLSYYVNGKLVSANFAGGDIESNPFYWGGDPVQGEWANGRIDDVALWTRALTGAEVQQLASGVRPKGLGGLAKTDVKNQMLNKSSLYIRYIFNLSDSSIFDVLTLRIKYDDGFIAYLNGVEVARRNAPQNADWNSTAVVDRGDSLAYDYEEIDLTPYLGLLDSGANVLAIQALNSSTNDPNFLILPELEADEITGLGARYFGKPTPGLANDPGVIGYVDDTKFSHNRGFYETNFELTISCKTPGAVIRYTLNGSAPSETNGFVYSGPIPIDRTMVVRAAAFKPGWKPSNIDTHTYIFIRDVINQTGAGFPTTWGSATADYAMDPRVVTNVPYRNTITNDLKSLPVVCITVNPDEFFGPQGIYSNPSWRGVNSERAASMEMIYPDGSKSDFNVNCGVRLAGGASRTMTPKKGLRVVFRDRYGPKKFNYKFFEDSEVDKFDAIQFRPIFNMSWVRTDNSGPLNNANADGAERTHAIYVRDQFTRESQIEMGSLSAHGRFVHLYINGLYWGMYNPTERTDAAFAASYLGGSKDEYDAIFSELSTPTQPKVADGDRLAWDTMFNIANAGLTTPEQYAAIQKYLDVTNLADYMMLNFYTCTVDWPWQNWNAVRRRSPDGRFIFLVWDAEYTLELPPWVPEDRTTVGTEPREAVSPARLYYQLKQNPEWRMLFADRAQKFFFNNGPLTTNQTIPRFLKLCDTIDRAIVGESARWGDVVRTTQPYTRDVEWVAEKNRLLTQFFPNRTALVIQQLKNAGLYPNVEAPSFSMQGARFSGYMMLTMRAPAGQIYYTTNGADPRLPGGALSPQAIPYTGPIRLTTSQLVRARVLSGTNWSALNEAPFVESTPIPLRIVEIMYNPARPPLTTNDIDDYEYIVLMNAGNYSLNLEGVKFTAGITFVFPQVVLNPGERIFVVKSTNAFETFYRYKMGVNAPMPKYVGEYVGTLSNDGERMRLEGALGELIQEFTYNDWYPLTDGQGFAIVANSNNNLLGDIDWSSKSRWRVGLLDGIMPYQPQPPKIYVNEVLSRAVAPMMDAIEIYNGSETNVDISGWFLTDDPYEPKKYRIPQGTIVPAGGYVVFYETNYNGGEGSLNPFGLGYSGDAVWIFSAASDVLTGYSHGFEFGAALPDVSFGRYIDSTGKEQFVLQKTTTLGAENSGPRVGPVVISEINYYSPNGMDEFVKIENISDNEVPLFKPDNPQDVWRINGIGFYFPAGTIIPPKGRILVVNSDPSVFRQNYGVPQEIPIYQYSGNLQDNGETISIEMPDTPTEKGPVYVVIDQVQYNNKSPWPLAAAGLGASLHRKDKLAFGNDPSNWYAAAPNPASGSVVGAAPMIQSMTGDKTVYEYADVVLSAAVTGSAQIYYQWKFNGDNIPGATNNVLILPKVTYTNDGLYTLVAFNSVGSTESAPVRLSVIKLPTIVQQPQSVSVKPGSNVVFKVVAQSLTLLRYQWRYNGVDIPGATSDTLTLSNVQLKDGGSYSVVVTDDAGSVESDAAQLVILIDPTIIQQPLSTTVPKGGNVTLSIEITNTATLPITYRWRRGSTYLATNTLMSYKSFFTITNVQTNANYQVIVSNPSRTAGLASSQATITVLNDSDGDGMPDVWELGYGFNTNSIDDATIDSDGDGMNNLAEYIAGTNPLDPSSFLKVNSIVTNNYIMIQFIAVSNRTYSVQYTDSLFTKPWTSIFDWVAKTNVNSVTITNIIDNNKPGFYRIVTPAQPQGL
jgi:hypothetical protein